MDTSSMPIARRVFGQERFHVGDLQAADLAPGQLVHLGHAVNGQLPALSAHGLGKAPRESPRI